jgi:hypothetical protein
MLGDARRMEPRPSPPEDRFADLDETRAAALTADPVDEEDAYLVVWLYGRLGIITTHHTLDRGFYLICARHRRRERVHQGR